MKHLEYSFYLPFLFPEMENDDGDDGNQKHNSKKNTEDYQRVLVWRQKVRPIWVTTERFRWNRGSLVQVNFHPVNISDVMSYSSMEFRRHFKHQGMQDFFWNDFIVTPDSQSHVQERRSL